MPYRVLDALDIESPNGVFRGLSDPLGVGAFRINRLELAPGAEGPEHDHLKDGQEEVYVVLDGSATLSAGAESWTLSRGMMARVGPAQKRKLTPGPNGVTILALGGTPGKAYSS